MRFFFFTLAPLLLMAAALIIAGAATWTQHRRRPANDHDQPLISDAYRRHMRVAAIILGGVLLLLFIAFVTDERVVSEVTILHLTNRTQAVV